MNSENQNYSSWVRPTLKSDEVNYFWVSFWNGKLKKNPPPKVPLFPFFDSEIALNHIIGLDL